MMKGTGETGAWTDEAGAASENRRLRSHPLITLLDEFKIVSSLRRL